MSSTIEDRIVQMNFKGEEFLKGIEKSLQKLEQFNSKLKLLDGTRGLENVGQAASRQHAVLGRIADSVSHISDRFKTLGVVGVVALSNITNQALFAAQRMLHSLTLEPILEGFREYETNLGSIQTILANTQSAGTTLKDVTAALDELNHYSDQTIYNFSEMARNIGTFTAAGVALKPATQAIKGIANLAALSGSNSQQAASAMYQLSQAIAAGRVTLMDWNSVVNAGMGGTVFQRALAQTAVKMGTLEKSAIKLSGEMKNVTINGKSFRDSISAEGGGESWLTSKVLTQTLAQFTGDLTDAELKVMGFNKTEIEAIQKQAKTAKAAATEVKTMSQLLGTLAESTGSGWAQTWRVIFGDFNEAKKLFTDVNNVIGGFISKSADSRNKVLEDWKALGGRTALIDGIAYAFYNLREIVTPIAKAFRDIFPRTTGARLAELSKSFRDFMSAARLGEDTMDNIRRTFRGVFAVVGIGIDLFKQIVGVVARLAGVAFDGSGGFLEFTARIGDFLVNLRKAIKEGKAFENFFDGIGDLLEIPLRLIKQFGKGLGDAFENFEGTSFVKLIGKISKVFEPFAKIGDNFTHSFDSVDDVVSTVISKLFKLGRWVAENLGNLGGKIADAFEGINWDTVFKGINTGLFASLVLMLRRFLGGGGGGGGFTGILDNISESIEGLTKVLSAMQNALNAAALLGIAGAIGILTLSLIGMSKIDADGLVRGTTAMAGLFSQLVGAALLLDGLTTFKGAAKLPLIATSMILLGGAILVLSQAMKVLATMDWESLGKGLTGVTALLAELVLVANLMPNPASFVLAAASLTIMSVGVKQLAEAVTVLGDMSWEDMARGLVGVAGLLGSLAIFANATTFSAKGFISGAVVLLMAKSIKLLADAVKDVSDLKWGEMARGLTAMAGALGLIGGALALIPPSSILSAAAMLIVVSSLGMIGDALKEFAEMSWGQLGKSIAVMASSLTVIAGALAVMQGTLPGAAALVVTAASLHVLFDVLEDMAKVSWGEFGKSMAVLGGSLGILAGSLILMTGTLAGSAALLVAAGALALFTPILITMGSLSWEVIFKGLGTLAGLFTVLGVAALALTPVIPSLFALALSIGAIGTAVALAGAGIALFGVGIAALGAGLTAIAASGVAAATAIVGMISVLVGGVPTIVELASKIISSILDLIITNAPKIGDAFISIMNTLLKAVQDVTPKIIETVLVLMEDLLDSLLEHAPDIQDAGITLMLSLLSGLEARMGEITTQGADVIISFLNGISKNIKRIANAATNVIIAFINEVGKNANKIADAGMKMIINFVNGLAESIRRNTPEMQKAGRNLATAIIDGMTGGLASGSGRIASQARSIASSALNAAKSVLGIRSPSKEFEKIGKFVNDGFVKGLDGNKSQVDNAFKSLKDQLSSAMRDSADDIDRLKTKLKKLTSARRKDYDQIKKVKAQLKQAKKENAAERKAYDQVTKALAARQKELGNLANKQDAINKQLEEANRTLQDAIRTRDDFNKRITEQFSELPDMAGEERTLAGFVDDMRDRIEKTQSFAKSLQRLRELGLNDKIYEELLAKGPDALPFIDDVLAAGQNGVNELNKLADQLDSVAGGIGKTASKELYQAGVDAAQGLVDGLKKQSAAIEQQMDNIAASMVRAIKKALGIKSPSREFMKIGEFSIDGLTKGLVYAVPRVEKTAASVGNQALASLQSSLSTIPEVLSNIDSEPTIRPILDLSEVEKGAMTLKKMFPGYWVSVGSGFTNAVQASHGYNALQEAKAVAETPVNHTELTYNQYNTSPKALSAAEIYRQTNNQLSRTKGALENANSSRS